MLAPINTFPQSIQEFWNAAQSRGLFPLAIARNSKAPIGEGWNVWAQPIPHPGAGGVGLRCGDRGLTAFDCDVNDADLSARLLTAFRAVLGPDVPVRWGRPGRFLIPYFLVDGPVQGRTFSFPNGDHLQLMGGQFVAYGPHKDTGKPYVWENWHHEFPRLTTAQVQHILAEVPALAKTSLRFGAEHETASPDELEYATPRTQDEWQAGRDAAMRYLGLLKQELLGRMEGRGSTIFAIVGILKFAEQHAMCTRAEIENAIIEAGHSLDEGHGGRTLGEEIARHDQLPVLRGNLIMQAIMSRRTLIQGLHDAQTAPTLAPRTGFEISLSDDNNELPWLIYQRIIRAEIHLLTGQSGAGKSSVATDLSIHVLKGQAWLDGDIEMLGGHILWIAAEDDYGTERRVRHLLKQEPNAQELADRFHLIRVCDPMSFEQQCVGQVEAMKAMGMRVDLLVLDTWGASGLCFADNDTEAVLKAMFILKSIAKRTGAALIVTDHLPLGNEDAFQKGNGAKSGNSGFVYRITSSVRDDRISIECGKARGAPKARPYTGRIVSENYGKDAKDRTTTINVFKRSLVENKHAEAEQTAVIRLAAMLPGVTATGMDSLRAGQIVKFESVAADLGHVIKHGEPPAYVISKDAAKKTFGDGLNTLLNSGHFRTMHSLPFFAIYNPGASVQQGLIVPFDIRAPQQKEVWPWQNSN